jgi:hypothetical protein
MVMRSAAAIMGPGLMPICRGAWPASCACHRPTHREALEQAVFHHLAGTGIAFLARLEDQHGGAVKVAGLGQVARRAHQHGGVAVVAAAVHEAGLAGFPGKVVVFGHGQRVHVGAQAHGHGSARWPLARAAPHG